MTIVSNDDTIAAIATPIGVGGISVIRVSGKTAFEVADKGFRGAVSLSLAPSHTIHFGKFVNSSGEIIDKILASVFRSPNSYTSDDTVEISCHGGIFLTRNILDLLLQYGARMAEPGEFTRRAFLNGRIDLTQAEAIADLIHSGSEVSRKVSLQQLEGRLSGKINEFREVLIRICSLLELELDFTEEGLEFIDKSNIIKELDILLSNLEDLLGTYSTGKIYREGVKVVLTGKPNVGKSSLLNLLLNENRAIVTEIPGTTRDVIEENIILEGILFKLVDTAGIRKSADIVEIEGIRRSESQTEDADIIVFIIDPTQGFNSDDEEILQGIKRDVINGQSVIVVENKIDIVKITKQQIDSFSKGKYPLCRISAKTGEGLSDLRKKLIDELLGKSSVLSEKSVLISNSRHRECLIKSMESLSLAKAGLEQHRSNDLIAIDMRLALTHLGEITGVITSEDVLNNIFSRFCIGK
ncbi:MAG: tRNA uridine-5-carboxymethylaminomethyl(34) synthesis GTPase MnmE [Bacteroidota bacterium]